MSLNEENARVMLLGCLMTVYVFFGALIIRKFESPVEKRLLRNYWKMYGDFEEKLINGTAEVDELKTLLYTYGNMTSTLGVPGQYEKWNFIGSLHFVVTIVTTIGESLLITINCSRYRLQNRYQLRMVRLPVYAMLKATC